MNESKIRSENRGPNLISIYPPNEVYFDYIPKKTLPSKLSLSNLIDQKVAFKIRTNQPTNYVVRPSEGVLDSKMTTIIEIIMQPTDYNPLTHRIDDKFQIVACAVEDTMSNEKIQECLKNTNNPRIQMTKLKVALKTEIAADSLMRKSIEISSSLSDNLIRKSMELPDNLMNSTNNLTSSQNINESLATSVNQSPHNYNMSRFTTPIVENKAQLLSKPNHLTEKILMATAAGTTKQMDFKDNQSDIISNFNSIAPSQKIQSVIQQFQRNDEEYQKLVQKSKEDEQQIATLQNEKKFIAKELENLKNKLREQEEMSFTLSQDRNTMKAELSNLKFASTRLNQANKTPHQGFDPAQSYQLWHLIGVAIIALVIGAILS